MSEVMTINGIDIPLHELYQLAQDNVGAATLLGIDEMAEKYNLSYDDIEYAMFETGEIEYCPGCGWYVEGLWGGENEMGEPVCEDCAEEYD